MNSALAKISALLAAFFTFAGRVAAESATFGWEATSTSATHALQPRMTGPTALNVLPDTKGVFKGEFLSKERCRLEAIHKLSLDKDGVPLTKKVAFAVPPVEKPMVVTLNGIERTRIFFQTEAIAFEPGECFLLMFKKKEPHKTRKPRFACSKSPACFCRIDQFHLGDISSACHQLFARGTAATSPVLPECATLPSPTVP